MYRAPFAVVLAVLLAVPVVAAETKFSLTGENTKITFVGTKPGGRHEGGFKKLSGTATVTDGNPTTLQIQAEIDADSLYSDNEKLTGHLKSPDFFGVKDNPKATATARAEPTAPANRPMTRNRQTTTAAPPAAGRTASCRGLRTSAAGGSGGMT